MIEHIPFWDTRKCLVTCDVLEVISFKLTSMSTTKRERDEEIVRELLRESRANAGLRQVDLAERLGAPQSFVSKYESGERRLDIIEVRNVCVALNTTLPAFAAKLELLLAGSR